MNIDLSVHEKYIYRCLQLAKNGQPHAFPNPLVGAVLVYNDYIIGEGFHKQYGQAHAEVNCINSVRDTDQHLLSSSTLYINLEPCSHYGHTPPCVDLILANNIKKVVIGMNDPYTKVNGAGVQKLLENNVTVVLDVLKKLCHELNKRFITWVNKKRPYIVLKWAQSKDGYIAAQGRTTKISNTYCDVLVHQWRSQEAAIAIGTHTALIDNPKLSVRYVTGSNPIRIVIDKRLELVSNSYLFNEDAITLVFNSIEQKILGNIQFIKIKEESNIIKEILAYCYFNNIGSIIVEGGAILINSFIEAGFYDDIRVITSNITLHEGVKSPHIPNDLFLIKKETIHTNTIDYYVSTDLNTII